MLLRAARRLHQSPRTCSASGDRFPRHPSRPEQVRWAFTGALRPRVTVPGETGRGLPFDSRQSHGARPIATATAYQPTHEPIPLLYKPHAVSQAQQSPASLSDLQQWDPKQPMHLPAALMQPLPALRRTLGIGGDVAELFQNLYACLRVNRIERAENIVKRIAEGSSAFPAEALRAHNVLIEAQVEELEILDPPREKEIFGLQKWFEREMKTFVRPNGDTYALMCRAALAVQTGIRRDRTLRRYLFFAEQDGLYAETLDSEKLTDAQADTLQQVYAGRSADTLLTGLGVDQDAGAPSTLSSHKFVAGEDLDIKSVPQKGEGLLTLVRSLHYVYNPGATEFPHYEDLTNKQKEVVWATRRQEAIERSVAEEALARWRRDHEDMMKMGISTALKSKPIAVLLWDWHQQLQPLLQKELDTVRRILDKPRQYSDPRNAARQMYGIYLEQMSAEQLSALTILQTMRVLATSDDAGGVKLGGLTQTLGKLIETESRMKAAFARRTRVRASNRRHTAASSSSTIAANSADASITTTMDSETMARCLFRHNEQQWPLEQRSQVAALLLSKFIEVAKVQVKSADGDATNAREEPGIRHETVAKNGRRYGTVTLHPELTNIMKREPLKGILGARLPMVVEPKPWTSYEEGGYLVHPTPVVRAKQDSDTQKLYTIAASEKGDMAQVFEGLNVLGRVPWRINRDVFKVMVEAWNSGEAIADFAPANPDLPYPPEPQDPTDRAARKVWLKQKEAIDNEKSGLHSERCFQNFQIEIARAYLGETFYCPHNLDFRGRVYPLPPYLNHMGADNARGLLMFGAGKKLGTTGLQWLKVHLANVAGFDKASLQERENFAVEHLDDVNDSVTNPLSGRRWWLKADDPWQCLATCFELKSALEAPDPTEFVSHLPIHQDGTCNGLQHYAALGGDSLGARQVNLEPGDRPADIYSAVAELVKADIAKDALAENPMALKLQGHITRKVVKQTVMTNVYGVTFVGAREQVQKQLDDILPDDLTHPVLNNYRLSAYIVRKIFTALEAMFTGAQSIQRWLGQCADRISTAITPEQLELIARREAGDTDLYGPKIPTKMRKYVQKLKKTSKLTDEFRSCVVWTTPLKMPVVQPYRTISYRRFKTAMQYVALREPKLNDPVSKRKQLQAFPPNFIHSLDATHMMLSAVRCSELGLTFASVHDSFWTHAADIPVMNRVLRDAFVRMHSEDIIGRLAAEFSARYKHSIYLTNVYASSDVGKAIINFRRSKGMKGTVMALAHNGKRSMAELLEEHKRQKLLRSKDPALRAEGRAMVTAASIFESFTDADSHRPPSDLESFQLGAIPDTDIGSVDAQDAVDSEPVSDAAVKASDRVANSRSVKKASSRKHKIALWLPLTFPEVPAKGDFDVARLRGSQYFFS